MVSSCDTDARIKSAVALHLPCGFGHASMHMWLHYGIACARRAPWPVHRMPQSSSFKLWVWLLLCLTVYKDIPTHGSYLQARKSHSCSTSALLTVCTVCLSQNWGTVFAAGSAWWESSHLSHPHCHLLLSNDAAVCIILKTTYTIHCIIFAQ